MMSSLWNAVMEDDVEMLQDMVRFGEVLDLNKYSDCGNGLMYVAVAKSRRRVLGYLHTMGLDVHSYCDQRQFGTPLFHAIYHECADVIRDLYFLGVDMEAPCDRFGHPPEKAAEILGKTHLIPQLQDLKTLKQRCSLRLCRFFRMATDRQRYLKKRRRHRSAITIQRRARGMAVRVRLDAEERAERARAQAAKEQAEAEAAAKARAEAAAQAAAQAAAKASEEASSKSGSSGSKSADSKGGGGWLGWGKGKAKK